MNKKPDQYVWYAAYGSNLSRNRFLCYINGGRPKGSEKTYTGCKDKSLPVDAMPISLSNDLYFALSSQRWQNGGVAFVKTGQDSSALTYAYMYLITKEQFCDVVKQENNAATNIDINFDLAIRYGTYNFRPGSWYGNLLYVGQKGECPIFTFTNENNIYPATKPSIEYLSMIISGLIETHALTVEKIVSYLAGKNGIVNNYSVESLARLVESLIN